MSLGRSADPESARQRRGRNDETRDTGVSGNIALRASLREKSNRPPESIVAELKKLGTRKPILS